MKNYTDTEIKNLVEKKNEPELTKLYNEYENKTAANNRRFNKSTGTPDTEIYQTAMEIVRLKNKILDAIG